MNKLTPDDKILRAQVKVELHNKRQCSYQAYQCSHLSIENSKYCLKHILQDKNAAFKQCNFFYQSSGKRCYLPAAKGDKKEYGYCSEHALKATLQRNKQNASNPPPLTAESLLSTLTHYVKKPKKSPSSGYEDANKNHGNDNGEPKIVHPIDPFVDIDASSIYSERCKNVLDMCSESESDVEPSTYATVWHDANADSSDNESIDSEEGDPLKHANVYTAEEITLMARDKLVKLQQLYVEEYKHLQYLLRERRRKYIHSLKREKETCCNIYNQVRDNPKEQRLYKKLTQYSKYHRSYGEDAILEKRLHDLRAKIAEGGHARPSNFSRCLFTEGGVKCAEKVLPMAKHCRKHILEDPNQVLFKACGKVNCDVECNTPVEALFDDSTCKLHMEIPLIRSYSQIRTSLGNKYMEKDPESEREDTLDLPPHYAMPTNDNVKTEMLDYSLPSLSKMETLPSLLFEDSAESLSSTLQYSTSEFTESFVEQNSSDVHESNTTNDIALVEQNESAINEFKPDSEINKSDVTIPKHDDESFQFKIQNFDDGLELDSELEEKTDKLNIEENLINKEDKLSEISEKIDNALETETENEANKDSYEVASEIVNEVNKESNEVPSEIADEVNREDFSENPDEINQESNETALKIVEPTLDVSKVKEEIKTEEKMEVV